MVQRRGGVRRRCVRQQQGARCTIPAHCGRRLLLACPPRGSCTPQVPLPLPLAVLAVPAARASLWGADSGRKPFCALARPPSAGLTVTALVTAGRLTGVPETPPAANGAGIYVLSVARAVSASPRRAGRSAQAAGGLVSDAVGGRDAVTRWRECGRRRWVVWAAGRRTCRWVRLRGGLSAAGVAAWPPWPVFHGVELVLGLAAPALSPPPAVDACGVRLVVPLLQACFREGFRRRFGAEKPAAEVGLGRRPELRAAGSCWAAGVRCRGRENLGRCADQGRAAGGQAGLGGWGVHSAYRGARAHLAR